MGTLPVATQQIFIHRQSCFVPSATTVCSGGGRRKFVAQRANVKPNQIGFTTLNCSSSLAIFLRSGDSCRKRSGDPCGLSRHCSLANLGRQNNMAQLSVKCPRVVGCTWLDAIFATFFLQFENAGFQFAALCRSRPRKLPQR